MVESSSSSPGAANKRNRDPEDEAYLDNFHSHKRYLSEIMASSLNGLTVGESMSEHLLDSPARSETMNYLRDDICMQFSPMSEDSDDGRYSESRPTSPSSPHRYQRGATTSTSYSSLNSVACSQPRQRGGSDSEGRFPSSPSDICHSADLRRAALLRSVQMRVHHPSAAPNPYDSLPSSPEQDSILQNMEAEDQPCSCQNQQQIPNVLAQECCSVKETESEAIGQKPCRVLHMNNVKEEVCEERTSLRKHSVDVASSSSSSSSSKRSILGESQ